MLEEISREEDAAGRGMLSALVVHKTGEQKPGGGFFTLAEKLGRDITDRDKVWIEEVIKVRAAWSTVPDNAAIGGRPIETLPFRIPEYSGASHPISRGTPKFYKPEALRDWGKGQTLRTEFFERILVSMFLRLGRSVPYAFHTIDGEIRSLDAGCLKFLLNRSVPEIAVICNDMGEIDSVAPLPMLINRYVKDSDTFSQFATDDVDPELSFDIEKPADERRRVESERVVREGAGAFRSTVLWAWGGRCALAGTSIQCTVDAAHLYPYNGLKTNDPSNGIALRSDIHSLFDFFLLSFQYINGRLVVDISKQLFGSEYEMFSEKEITLPSSRSHRPHPKLIEHHHKRFLKEERERV